MTNTQIADKIWATDFEAAWKICKAHGKFKGQQKQLIKNYRDGMPAMLLMDLYNAGKLTQEQKTLLGI